MTGENVGHDYFAVTLVVVAAAAVVLVLADSTDPAALSVMTVRRGWVAVVRDGRGYVGKVDRKVRLCQRVAHPRPYPAPSFASWSSGGDWQQMQEAILGVASPSQEGHKEHALPRKIVGIPHERLECYCVTVGEDAFHMSGQSRSTALLRKPRLVPLEGMFQGWDCLRLE